MSLRPTSICLLTSAILFGACGDDDSSSTRPAVEVIPGVTLDVRPADAPQDPGEPAAWIPCNGAMVATLTVENWELSVPGTCGEKERCGHVLVRATSANTTPLSVRSVTSTVFVGLVPPADWAGTVDFVARLSLDDGTPYRTVDGRTVEHTLSLVLPLKEACGGSSGEGGGGGAAAEGGAANEGGSANGGSSQGGTSDGGTANEGGTEAAGTSAGGAAGATDAGAGGTTDAGAGGTSAGAGESGSGGASGAGESGSGGA
jgi:hypothetical protein